MAEPPVNDIFQWEVRTWSRALPVWKRHLPAHRPATALAIGEREGGLSLWLAWEGLHVTCTDVRPFPPTTRALHVRHGVQDRITYAEADATRLPFPDDHFDVVCFKSVLGALGTKEAQAQAIGEMHRVLKPATTDGPGGVLLFAENLAATGLHAWLRKRFVSWEHRWRYLHLRRDRDLFGPFARMEEGSTGLLAVLGRSETQRDVLARADGLLAPAVPGTWRTVWFGAARKG